MKNLKSKWSRVGKIGRAGLCLALMLSALVVNDVTVLADGEGEESTNTIDINNNGAEKENAYGRNTSYSSAYSDISNYTDIYYPYSLSLADIGGCAEAVVRVSSTGAPPKMETNVRNSRAGDTIGEVLSASAKGSFSDFTTSVDNGIWIYTDKHGNQYYGISVTPFIVRSMATDSQNIESAFSGKLIDIVLTDGTVIYCVGVTTSYTQKNTNGGENGHPTTDGGATHNFNALKKTQYQNMFEDLKGYVFGLNVNMSSGVQSFVSKYGIGSRTHIAFIRVYGDSQSTGKYSDVQGERANKGVSTTYTAVGSGSTQSQTVAMGNNDLSIVGGSMVTEDNLVGMPSQWSATDSQSAVNVATRDGLSKGEISSVGLIGENINLKKKTSVLDIERTIATFAGLALMLYGFVIVLALLFDKVNTFLEVSMVSMVTFGAMKYSPSAEEGMTESAGYSSTRKVVTRGFFTIFVGLMIMSTGLTKLTGWFLYKIMNHFV